MAGLKPLLGNSQNWLQIYSVTQIATVINSTPPSYQPIPPFVCPIQFSNPTLGIYVNTQDAKLTWKSGGLAACCIVTGILKGGNSESEIGKRWLTLNGLTICRFPELSDSYSLKLYPPRWFKSYFVEVWEYIGPGKPDTEGKIDALYDTLNL